MLLCVHILQYVNTPQPRHDFTVKILPTQPLSTEIKPGPEIRTWQHGMGSEIVWFCHTEQVQHQQELRQVYPALFQEEVEVTFGSEYKGVCIEADADTACVSPYHLKVPGVGGQRVGGSSVSSGLCCIESHIATLILPFFPPLCARLTHTPTLLMLQSFGPFTFFFLVECFCPFNDLNDVTGPKQCYAFEAVPACLYSVPVSLCSRQYNLFYLMCISNWSSHLNYSVQKSENKIMVLAFPDSFAARGDHMHHF